MSDQRVRILVVEDEALVALDVEEQLVRLGYDVVGVVDSCAAALERAREAAPDLVLMDIHLRGEPDGIAAAEKLRDEPGVPVVFLTAFADAPTLERAKQVSPHGYVLKPFDQRDLRTAIEIAVHRDRLERELRRSHENLLALLDVQRTGIVLLDDGGRIQFANVAARSLASSDADLAGVAWQDAFALAEDDRRRIAETLGKPRAAREKLAVRLEDAGESERAVEIEVEDDPRDASGHILLLYDVSELRALRRLLDDRGTFHDIVGRSDPIRRVVDLVHDVAPVDVTVLVLGETGTGKELVARAIHAESARSSGPFVAVNCAGLSEDLAASQLFGHRRGSFTGAVADSAGVFEAAHGGTLFLDEIGDLPPRIQTALLRVLEERKVARLGETKLRDVDVRIVAATNRDLQHEVAAGRFRADLLYRIRVGRISLPALRERRGDIWLLARHALAEASAAAERDVGGIGDEALRALMAYDWPGNVRELRNAIAYAAIHCRGPLVQLEDLPPEILDVAQPMPAAGLPTDERARIVEALARTGGERKAAAALLGIGRATLYRKLAQYGLG